MPHDEPIDLPADPAAQPFVFVPQHAPDPADATTNIRSPERPSGSSNSQDAGSKPAIEKPAAERPTSDHGADQQVAPVAPTGEQVRRRQHRRLAARQHRSTSDSLDNSADNHATTGVAQSRDGTAADPTRLQPFRGDPEQSGGKPESQRYQRLSELGRGGWGVVERALDQQLEREVAIKRLGAEAALQAEVQARFLHEAKITSQLQHPGIVPVHELGTSEDGEAYYVMKLLDGNSLRDHIRAAHQRLDTKNPKPIELRAVYLPLLERFIDVCHAMAYAHERGIIHRDLKPANVMVGEFGETIVVDWGLAKKLQTNAAQPADTTAVRNASPSESGGLQLGSSASQSHSAVADEAEPRSTTHSDSGSQGGYDQTTCGTVIGTPAYMSPEQASGDVDRLNAQSDIFSLGTMLFEIVNGRSPFAGQKIDRILEQVKRGEIPSLRSRQAAAPRALEAICRTAMAHDPAQRYRSAAELAADVQRFVVGDPVSVYREPLTKQASRWLRKHHKSAWLMFGALVSVTVSSFLFSIVIHRAHRLEQAARVEAEVAHRDALVNLTHARESADAWLVDLSGVLEFYPGLAPIRSDLVNRAKRDYGQLVSKLATGWSKSRVSPASQVHLTIEFARAKLRLGDLLRLHPHGPEDPWTARHMYTQAEELLAESNRILDEHSELTNREETLTSIRVEQVNACIGLLLTSELESAATEATAAAVLSATLPPLEVWLASQPAISQHHRGQDFSSAHSLDHPAATELSRNMRLNAKLISAFVRLQIAKARTAASRDLSADSIGNDVANQLHLALSSARSLAYVRGNPADLRLAETCADELASALGRLNRPAESQEVHSQLVADLEAWSSRNPQRSDLLQSLAYARLNQAERLAGLQLAPTATQSYRNAITDLQKAWHLTDAGSFFQANLAGANFNVAQLLLQDEGCSLEKFDEVQRRLRYALAGYEDMLAEETSADMLRRLSDSHRLLAETLWLIGDDDQIPHWQSAILGLQMLADHGLETASDRAHRANSQLGLVRAYLGSNRLLQAAEALQLAEQVRDGTTPANTSQATLGENTQLASGPLHRAYLAARIELSETSQSDADRLDHWRGQLLAALERDSAQELQNSSSIPRPLATIARLDSMLEPTGRVPTTQQLAQASALQAELQRLWPVYGESAECWQRTAILSWRAGDINAAIEAIERCQRVRPGDLLDAVLAKLIRRSPEAPLQLTPASERSTVELLEAANHLINHKRLQYWADHLKLPTTELQATW